MKTKVSTIIIMAMLFSLPAIALAGDMNPPDPPGPTMKTLDQIPPTWSQKLPCDEGNCPRFEEVMNGYAVLDKETGLVWAKNASVGELQDWYSAQNQCYNIGIGGRKGWRLPTVDELASLLDPQQTGFPCLPSGHPFINVMNGQCWSATPNSYNTDYACYVDMGDGGYVNCGHLKTSLKYVWPVRGGQ